MKQNQDTYTLITGASRGLGEDFAKLAAEAGQNLILVARSKSALEQLAADLRIKYRVQVHVISMDLSDPSAAIKVFEKTQNQNWLVDKLINNAGFGVHGPFLKTDFLETLQMLQLNMLTLTHFCSLYGKEMKRLGRGKILNVASTAAFQPGPGFAGYYATKAYVLSLSEALDYEMRKEGISVTCLCPGPTRTGFQERARMGDVLLFRKGLAMDSYPVARSGFRAMMSGKRVVIPGVLNWISAFMVRLLPRSLVLWISGAMTYKENENDKK
jgi:short-subunit dehydrogenase